MQIKFTKLFFMSVLAVSTVDVSAQTVKGTVALPGYPEQVAADPFLNRVYVAIPNFGLFGDGSYDYLTVVDGKRDVVLTNIQIAPIGTAVAVDYVRKLVYVGGQNSLTGASEVSVVSSRTNKVLSTITVTSTTSGTGVLGLAVNLETGTLYAANSSDNEIDVIRHGRVTSRIALTGEPVAVSVNPFKGMIYASRVDGFVDIISEETNTVTTSAPFGALNQGIAVDLATGNVLVVGNPSAPGAANVGILNPTGTLLSTIAIGNGAVGIDIDPFTHLAFAANAQDDTLSVIDDKTDSVTLTMPVSSLFLAVNPLSEKVYVSPIDAVTSLTVVDEGQDSED
jgi:DNA-binding beta-propeller fold protein YncE